MEPVELILYATPTGRLADQCSRYFGLAAGLGATTAQRYPPHCTLTGFFRRRKERIDAVGREVDAVLQRQGLGSDGRVEGCEVSLTGPRATADWVGLELRSQRLAAVAQAFAAHHQLDRAAAEDEIRVKSWLHLSLAYGGVDDLAPYARLAEECIDGGGRADWEVALWLRSQGDQWRRLTGRGQHRR